MHLNGKYNIYINASIMLIFEKYYKRQNLKVTPVSRVTNIDNIAKTHSQSSLG